MGRSHVHHINETSTFRQVLRFVEKNEVGAKGSAANRKSILKKFIEVNGLSWDDQAKPNLLDPEKRQKFLEKYRQKSLGSVTSHLGVFEKLVANTGPKNLAKLLKQGMEKTDLMREDVATVVDVTPETLRVWLSGDAPSIELFPNKLRLAGSSRDRLR